MAEPEKAEKAEKAEKTEKTEKTETAGEPRRTGRFGRSGKRSPSDDEVVPGGDGPRSKGSRFDLKHLRIQVARLVGLVFLVLALLLAAAALCIALEANAENSFVSFVLDAAEAVDLGVFDLDNPIKEFGGSNGDTKEALLNYGLGAIFYLVVGRILERIVRP